jgi:hypothetical protein
LGEGEERDSVASSQAAEPGGVFALIIGALDFQASLRGAIATRQSSLAFEREALDCRVASLLAMTIVG